MSSSDSLAPNLAGNAALSGVMAAEYSTNNVLCPHCGGYTSMNGRHQARYAGNHCFLALLCQRCDLPVYGYISTLRSLHAPSTVEF